jgi:hypothetical protein
MTLNREATAVVPEAPSVAKKRPKVDAGKMYGPSKPIIIQMRGSLAFKEWARELARHDRSLLPDLIERLLVNHARAVGFAKAPPDR